MAVENGVVGQYELPFCSQTCYSRKIVKTYSHSSFSVCFNDISFSSLALSEPNNRQLKFPKMIREVSAEFWRQKAPRESFLHLQTTVTVNRAFFFCTHCCSYFHTFFALLYSFLYRHPPLPVKVPYPAGFMSTLLIRSPYTAGIMYVLL
jgi:hypothetical protein